MCSGEVQCNSDGVSFRCAFCHERERVVETVEWGPSFIPAKTTWPPLCTGSMAGLTVSGPPDATSITTSTICPFVISRILSPTSSFPTSSAWSAPTRNAWSSLESVSPGPGHDEDHIILPHQRHLRDGAAQRLEECQFVGGAIFAHRTSVALFDTPFGCRLLVGSCRYDRRSRGRVRTEMRRPMRYGCCRESGRHRCDTTPLLRPAAPHRRWAVRALETHAPPTSHDRRRRWPGSWLHLSDSALARSFSYSSAPSW
jgi:hypothetical protein